MSSNSNASVSGARYSAISAMHSCRKSAWHIYGKKKSGFKNHFAKLGIVIHNVLEDYGNWCIEHQIETDYAKWDEFKFKHLNYLEETQIKEASELLDKIKENLNWGGILQFPIIEIEKRYKINKDFGQPLEDETPYLSGGIDIVFVDDDVVYAEDYKTVRAIYTDAYMRDSLQRKIYSALIFAAYPEAKIVKFAFNFARYGYKSKYYEEYRENIEELNKLVASEVNALYELLAEEEEPEASPSGFCQLCEVRGMCDAYKNAYTLDETLETSDNAVRLYNEFRLAEIKIAETKDLIKAWIEVNGPIKLKYEEYGPQLEEKESYPDTQKVIELLKKKEIPEGAIFDALKFTKTSLNKILKKFKIKDQDKEPFEKVKVIEKVTKFKEIKIHEVSQDEDEGGTIDPYV